MNIKEKLNRIHTPHVWINPKACTACWECINQCPRDVIGKVGFLWHKHIIIKNPDRCIGCNKCIRTCKSGVFTDNMPMQIKKILKRKLSM